MSDVLDDFFEAGNEIKPAAVDPTMQALLDHWQAAIRRGAVGFLPRRAQQRTYWYAFAPSQRQRRELLGLLDAWVGPTYSDLEKNRGELEPSDPFDAALASREVMPLRFEVLPRVAPHSAQAKEAVRNALTILTRLANERPPSQFDAMRTTVEILDDLGHAVAAHDRALAEACMAELEQSADLDEANLAFLRLRNYAGMHDWAAMFKDPALDHVLSMRRPLGVTRVIQSGLYYERFRDVDHRGAEADLRAAAEELEPALRDLYTGAPPNNRAEAVVELVCRLLTTRSATDTAVIELLGLAPNIQSGLDEQFLRIVEAFVPMENNPDRVPEVRIEQPTPTTTSIASLMLQGEYAACIELGVASEPSLEAGRALVYAARQMASASWANKVVDYLVAHDLKEAVASTTPILRTDVAWLESVRLEWPVRGWDDWFASLEDPESATLRLSNETVQEWKPLSANKLTVLLTEASDTTLGKLGECGGQFLAAHSDVFESEVTLRLIASMALGSKASAGVRVQTLALIESLSASSPSQAIYQDALDWTAEIMETNAAAITVAWICDIVQTLTAIPAPGSTASVLSFYFKAIEVIRPYRTALANADVEALAIVAAELGTELPADFRAAAVEAGGIDPTASYRYLEGKKVVLHSLTETAIARAAQVLKRLVPSVDVSTNSDHDGSTQLAQMSANADVFVVVTAAAKHAATTFIAGHRGSRPIVWVNSRGSSAILRELTKSTPGSGHRPHVTAGHG
ncbi:hypothetical protein QFZ30_003062 [Arthrobacter pascens]|uniref:protein DpdD n=1 Tax=Arthrobacter pascens TaxID=1677 RepID=UPI00278F7B3F|nr:protein DpdD [Arthrobacter pascens]MDQ0679680.1 hypothetical protein [Arthrobacter pascens]